MEAKIEDFKNFHFDEDYDNLIISQKNENDVIKENFMFDDFIFSLTEQGKIAGIEIMNVSDYLDELGIKPTILREIINAGINVKSGINFIYIGISLITDKKEQKIPIANIPKSIIKSNMVS